MRRRTWSNDTSTPRRRTGSGWPTSPPLPLTRAGALRADLGGVRVPGRGARRVQPAHRGLGDARPSSYRTGPRSAEHGRQAAPARGGDPSLRPRLAIHLARVRQTLPGDGGASLDRCSFRTRTEDGAVRLYRRLVQPPPAPLRLGLSQISAPTTSSTSPAAAPRPTRSCRTRSRTTLGGDPLLLEPRRIYPYRLSPPRPTGTKTINCP